MPQPRFSPARLAVNRPVTTGMVCLIVAVLGWVALRQLTIDLMPDVTYPTLSVTTVYDGAGPEEIETLITRPLEQRLSSVHGVEELASESMEGSSTIRVRFRWGTDLDTALGDIRGKLEEVRDELPEDIEPPYIRRYDVADRPIIYLGLSSRLDRIARTRLAEKTIAPRLERIAGVARVRVRGGVRREIQVELDRDELQALDLNVSQVVQALQQSNVSRPAGDFEQGHVNLLLRSRGEYRSLEEIAETIVRQQNGAVVRVGDIARVIDGEEERHEKTRVNGKAGLLIYIYKQPGANTVHVSDRCHEAIEELNASLPNSHLALRIDKSNFIRRSIAHVRQSALYGTGLAVLVLLIFLRSLSSTLVIAVSMPLSVLATFVLIEFQGFTLNLVSFGGLALGIGLLVDNSIVVLESIYRRREEGDDPKTAAVEGTQEVASAIVASTLTTLIVFLPLAFIKDMTGVVLHQLAWVVCFSLFCSLLVSLTLTPMLAAYWGAGTAFSSPDNRLQWFHSLTGRGFARVEAAYRRLLRGGLRYAGTVGFLLLLALSSSVGLVPRIGTEFIPKTDQGDLRVYAKMAPGIQLETLDRQARRLEETILQTVPESETTAAFIGDDSEDAEDWNEAWFRVHLGPRSERSRSAEQIRKELSENLPPVPGMEVNVRSRSRQVLVRMLERGRGADIEVQIYGHDLATGQRLSEQVAEIMKDVPGLFNVEVDMGDQRPELDVAIDRAKAGSLGVQVEDITAALETTVRGRDATVYREAGDEFNLLVRLREADRNRLGAIRQIGVATAGGRIVPLKNFVNFQPGEAPVSIERTNRQRTFEIDADVEERDLGHAVADLKQRLQNMGDFPRGFSWNIAGDWEEQQKSFTALRWGFVLAVVLMYMVMASQFESVRDPLLILLTLPLGGIGVILVLVGTGTTLNVQSFIGVIMLAGIVVNNTIVLIDYVNQLRRNERELSADDVVERAALRRFRPILMTTLTTVLAMLPIALGWGEGGELQAPMARVVIGGLLSGTLISLLAIPLLWRYLERGRAIS